MVLQTVQCPLVLFSDSERKVNPVTKLQKGTFDPRKDLSKGLRREQWLSGWKFLNGIRQKLWSGMPVTNANKAAFIDLFGFDASLSECVMRSAFASDGSAGNPVEMCITTSWSQNDLDCPNSNFLIAKFVLRTNMRLMRQLVEEKLYFLDDWSQSDFSMNVAPPVLNSDKYCATFPSAAGKLALRQDWITAQESKFRTEEVKGKWKELVDRHNSKWNPSGVPHTEASRKRGAEGEGDHVDAEEIPAVEGQIESKEQFLTENPGAICCVIQNEEFYYTESGQLWVYGVVDDIIKDDVFVGLIYGNFLLDDEATKAMKKGGTWTFSMNDADHVIGATAEIQPKGDSLPSTTMPLSAFLGWLEQNDIIKPGIECHDITVEFEKDEAGAVTSSKYKVNCSRPCCLQPLSTPSGFKDGWDNVGSKLCLGPESSMDWKTGKVGVLVLRDRLSYLNSKQFQGVAPSKPGLVPEKHIKVAKGTLRRWA